MRRNWISVRTAHAFAILQKYDVFPSKSFCGEICDDRNSHEHWGGGISPLKLKMVVNQSKGVEMAVEGATTESELEL